MSLRSRLFMALLALALLPTAIFTWFTLDQLNRAIDRWYRPGVASALEAGLEIGKGSLARLETRLMTQAGIWAERWGAAAPSRAQRAELAAALPAGGVDFVQVYRQGPDGGWTRADQIVPPGVLIASPPDLAGEIPAALSSGRALRSSGGVLAGIARTPGGAVLVAGIWTQPDFFAQIERLGQGAVYYRQLGVYVDVQRGLYALLIAVVVVVLVGTALVLANAIARGMGRPIEDLSRAIGRVAAGDLATRVSPAGAAELASLGASFNTMTERLETARSALQQAEREAAWRDVARKLAHEFKNILTPLKLSLQLLECQKPAAASEREAYERSLHAALREVDHLNRLSEQFSQYARLPEPNFEILDLGALARGVLEAEETAPTPVLPKFTDSLIVRGDRLLLSRALHNLLLNAREASPPGSAVELEGSASGGWVRLEIRDHGPGLPGDLRSRLFEPYVSTKRRGSGLGLSLVRDIVGQHGGTITLENAEGGGARAILSLPRAQAAERTTRAEPPRAGGSA